MRSIRSRRRDTAGLDEFFAAADAGDPRVSALRRELCVLDSRFTETPNGLFALLEGTLNCRIEGVNPDTIKAAETTPPPGTRAKARGDLVAQLHGNGTRYQAGWCSIRDRKERLTYQFESPISLSGVWVKKINLNSSYHWVGLAYNSGDFATVRKLVDEAYEYLETQGNLASASRFLIYRAWVEARSGDVDKAVETLREAHRNRTVSDSIVDHVAVYRWRGLTPEHTPIWRWIARREKLGSQNFDQLSNVAFQGYRGHALMKARRFEEAEASLRASIETDFERPNHVRLQSICRCDLANCLRLRGATDKAGGLLKQAHDHLSENRYLWELNDAWLPNALKLYGVDSMPQTRLKDARRSLRRMGNLIGVARLMLLEARGSAGRGIRPRSIVPVHHLRDRVHDLRDCPLLAKILDHWEPWIEGEPLMQDPDYYWGL